MDVKKERDLDRLVSAMYDDGASEQDMRRLESLLKEDPALQTRYWQMVSTHVALGVTVGASRDGDAPISARVDSQRRQTSRPSILRGSFDRFNSPRATRLAAAVVFVAACLGTWNHLRRQAPMDAPQEASNQSLLWTVDRMPTITHVSWNGPSFSDEAEQWQPVAAVGAGAVSLQVKQGRSADGYLFCLPPGASVELVATFDATGENCLSVAEITADDRPPVRKATFNNSGVGPRPLDANPAAKNRRYGVLGRWSEYNATSAPRFFLLTGSHKLAAPNPGEDWQLSEMTVLLSQDEVIHIGWDDSGPAPAEGEAYHQDDDFDDLAATLFLSSAGSSAVDENSLHVIGEDMMAIDQPLPEISDAYRVTLAPGEMALLKVASQASAPNAFFLIDAQTDSVRWATSNRTTRSLNLGAAAVFNRSAFPREFLIVAANQAKSVDKAASPWKESQRKILYEQAGYVILGYEDAKRDEDFNDIRVSLLRGSYADLPAGSGT